MSLNFVQYRELLKDITIGKQLLTAVYLHESVLESLPKTLAKHFAQVVISLEIDDADWNIIKFFERDHKITLLYKGTGVICPLVFK